MKGTIDQVVEDARERRSGADEEAAEEGDRRR